VATVRIRAWRLTAATASLIRVRDLLDAIASVQGRSRRIERLSDETKRGTAEPRLGYESEVETKLKRRRDWCRSNRWAV
jgi:hypothetical protein